MSLDLFFVPPKPSFTELRAAGFKPKPAMLKQRRAVVAALLEAHEGTRLEGDASRGYLADFPRGELTLHPGTIHWSLHHVEDLEPVQVVVDWFLAQGLVCEDPQGAGFDNREAANAMKPQRLASLQDLVGAALLGFRFDGNMATAITFEWTLADGRQAITRFHHLGDCRLPALTPLVKARVTATTQQMQDDACFEDVVFQFDGGHELRVSDSVFDKAEVSPLPARGKR